ncbi:MAG TPA: hypothetical protein VGK48_07535 [Terriglobia bacterium]|jgi:hypothetical protein
MFNVYLLAAFLFLQNTAPPLPELKPFLAELRKTIHTDSLLLSQYTYIEKHTDTELDSKNQPKKTEVNAYQVFPGSPEHVGYRRQTEKDGRPLTPDEAKKEEEALRKRIAESQQQRGRLAPAERDRRRAERLRKEQEIIDDAFGVFDVQITGRENIDGRPAIVLQFRPKVPATYKPKTFDGKNMQHVAGKVWVDEQDHQLARVEIEVTDTISIGLGILARLQKGASIVAERRKFNDEIWLPVRTDIRLNAKIMLLKGFNLRQITEYSDHKKYSVDTILKY